MSLATTKNTYRLKYEDSLTLKPAKKNITTTKRKPLNSKKDITKKPISELKTSALIGYLIKKHKIGLLIILACVECLIILGLLVLNTSALSLQAKKIHLQGTSPILQGDSMQLQGSSPNLQPTFNPQQAL